MACGSFGGSDNTSGENDGAAPNDATASDGSLAKDGSVSLTDGGPAVDGSSDGSTLPPTFCQRLDGSIFCDDFDRVLFDAGWVAQDAGADGAITLTAPFEGGSPPNALSFVSTGSSDAVATIPVLPLASAGDAFTLRLKFRTPLGGVIGNVPVVTAIASSTGNAITTTQLLFVNKDGTGVCISAPFTSPGSHEVAIQVSVTGINNVSFSCKVDGESIASGGGGANSKSIAIAIGPTGGPAHGAFVADDVYITRP